MVSTTSTFANSEDWLVPGQTYYIAVGAYDGEAEDLDADGIPGVVIWSDEVTGVPLGASFELAATDPAVTVVGGGDSETISFQVINTGDREPNVGLYVEDAPDGINVTLADRFVLATAAGAVTALDISATDTLRGGVYPVTIAGSAGGTVRTLELLITVEEPRFELAATPTVVTMQTGESAQVQIDATRLFGEADPINLDVTAPSGLDWSLDDDRLEGSDSATLTLSDTSLLPGGDYTLHVVGRDGENEYDLAIPLVMAKPKFTLAAAHLNWWVAPDASVAIKLDVGAEYGWDTPVTLSINPDYLPHGITGGLAATPSGTPVSTLTVTPPTSVYLKLSAAADTAEDLYVLHVNVESGGQTEVVEPRLWVRTTCDVADLSLTVEDAPDPVHTGDQFTYGLNLVNNGPCPSATRTLTSVLPAGVTFLSGNDDITCSAIGGTVTCNVPALTPDVSPLASITVRAPSSGTGSLSTTFSLNDIAADWESGNDSAAGGDTAQQRCWSWVQSASCRARSRARTFYVVAAFTDADGNAPFICTVDYGDGAQPGSVVSDADGNKCVGPAYFYSDSGDYDVTIRVTDSYAAPGVKEETLAVANAAPVVGALDITPNPATENAAVIISASFTDAGLVDGDWTCTIDFGDGVEEDGSVTSGTCLATAHTYADNGAFQVTIAVTDKDGGIGTRIVVDGRE